MALQTGQVLNNRYRIVKLLGQGGYGAVYRAWDINFQMPCAVKENTETGQDAQRQFLREAKILHTLRHDCLPLVKDHFIIPNKGQYLVMDFIEGDDLATIIQREGKPFPEDQVLKWVDEICQALEFLHSRTPPIIHRDIKPANIKITPEGKAVLVDFGISKVYDPNLPTTQGARGVTPGYSPFEQYGNAPTDNRTDIYSLGATAYSLLSASVPLESIARMAGQELTPLKQINPTFSDTTLEAITKAMELMPNDRFSSATDFRQALQAQTSIFQTKPQAGVAHTTQVAAAQPHAAPVHPAGGEAQPQQIKPPAAKPSPKAQASIGSAKKITPRQKAIQPPARKKQRARWLLVLVVVAVLIGAIFAVLSWLPISNNGEGIVSIAGNWDGVLEEYHEERIGFESHLYIKQSTIDEGIDGVITLSHPDGNIEEFPFEGVFDGYEIRMVDARNIHYSGTYQDNLLMGEYSQECFECEPMGFFEFHRK
ncbi:serine/threonine protein kinase [Chloroflexota bacterium]